MIFTQIGGAGGAVLLVKAAKPLLGGVRDGDKAVELLQQHRFVQGGKGGEGRGQNCFGGEARLLERIVIIGGVFIGKGQQLSQPFLLEGTELFRRLFLIGLQHGKLLQ